MKDRENADLEKYVLRNTRLITASFLCSLSALAVSTVTMEKEVHVVETKVKTEKPIIIMVNPKTDEATEPENIESMVQDILEETVSLNGIEYLESCVEAEAGNQGTLGKAYVCDVVLNRLDKWEYDTVADVINDSGQFSCVSNGSINKVTVSEETVRVVENEVKNRTDDEILFFRTQKYHAGTKPCFQYLDHYFSK